jgi:hypothetical protein
MCVIISIMETPKKNDLETSASALPPFVRQWLQSQGVQLPPDSTVAVRVISGKELPRNEGVPVAAIMQDARAQVLTSMEGGQRALSPAHEALLQKISGLRAQLESMGNVMDERCRGALQKLEEAAGETRVKDAEYPQHKMLRFYDAFWELHILVTEQLEKVRKKNATDPYLEQGETLLRGAVEALKDPLREHQLAMRTFHHAREVGAEWRQWLDVSTQKKVLETEGRLQTLIPALEHTTEHRCMRRAKVLMT